MITYNYIQNCFQQFFAFCSDFDRHSTFSHSFQGPKGQRSEVAKAECDQLLPTQLSGSSLGVPVP